MSLLLVQPDLDAAALAAEALASIRGSVVDAVGEMVEEQRHVLVYQEGQEHLAHLALQGVAKTIVTQIQETNPSLNNLIVLDSTTEGWDVVSPAIDIVDEHELTPGFLHRSQSIVAFGSSFLSSHVVQPVMRYATRFYAAIPDGPEAEALIEKVHPASMAVTL